MADDCGEWISARDALAEVASGYSTESAQFLAKNAIERRLVEGTLLARSNYLYFLREGHNGFEDSFPLDYPGKTIPRKFWTEANAVVAMKSFDYSAGDFEFDQRRPSLRSGFYGKAHGVEFMRLGLPVAPARQVSLSAIQPAPLAPMTRRVRDVRPRLSDAALAQWWAALADDMKSRGQDELLMACRNAFPRNAISRERIRELTGPRKRGPKPIRGKETA